MPFTKSKKSVQELLQEEWLTTTNAAAIAQVSNSTVIKWVTDGHLHSTSTIGKHRRIATQELLQFLRNREFALSEEVRPLRALLVDDYQPLLRALSREAMAYKGKLEVSVEASGVDALALMGARKFDVVVMDVAMPGMDGFAVCRAIKASQYMGTPDVILMTGRLEADYDAKAKEVGAITLLRKPLQLGTIVNSLKEHMFLDA